METKKKRLVSTLLFPPYTPLFFFSFAAAFDCWSDAKDIYCLSAVSHSPRNSGRPLSPRLPL